MFASVAPILISDNNADIDPHEQIDMVWSSLFFLRGSDKSLRRSKLVFFIYLWKINSHCICIF